MLPGGSGLGWEMGRLAAEYRGQHIKPKGKEKRKARPQGSVFLNKTNGLFHPFFIFILSFNLFFN